jgi:hypothetical protein
MRSNRRRNWFIKRIALGLAVAAFAAPVAQARVDEGQQVQGQQVQPDWPSLKAVAYKFPTQTGQVSFPRALPSDYAQLRGDRIELVRSVPRSTGSDIVAADYGMPRAMPNDYALSSGDQIEVVRSQPRGTSSDNIEFVRTQPRSIGEPQAVAAGFDWNDGAIGAGLMLGLVLLGGAAALATRHVGRAQTA